MGNTAEGASDGRPRPPWLDSEEVEKLRTVLERAVGTFCPRWLSSLREDIVQSAIVRVLKQFERESVTQLPPSSYLWKVAYSATMDEIRTHRRRREETLDETGEMLPDPSTKDSADQLAQSEIWESIVSGLDKLSHERRRVVQLYLYGFGRQEVAELLRFNVRRVDNLRYQGLRELRNILEQEGVVP